VTTNKGGRPINSPLRLEQAEASTALAILADMDRSSGTPRDMTSQQIAEVRDYLTGDLFSFAWIIFGYTDLDPKLHGEICELVRRWSDDPAYRRTIVQIPRGHLKTSVCTIANSLWQICRDPDHTVAVFNEKEDNASKWIRAIKNVVQGSPLFHTIFKDLMPPGVASGDSMGLPKWWKWSDTELLFQRGKLGIPEASITALGIGSAAAGGHWNKVIKDDLISEDAAHQPSTMERAKDWLDNSYYLEKPALGGQDLIACTPWSYRDAYSYCLGRYDYKLYRRSALEDENGKPSITGEPIFPAKFTREAILSLRADGNDYHWWAQMMCLPRPGKETAFLQEWLRFGSVQGNAFYIEPKHFSPDLNPARTPEPPVQVVPLSSMTKALILDPAPTERTERNQEPGARNAFVMMGHDFWGRKYILETRATRDNPSDVIDIIIEMCREWECDTVGIEEVNFSVIYKHWLEERSRRADIQLYPKRLSPGKRDKDKRIREKIPGVREGIYYINRPCEKLFLQEYLEYPYGATRDLLDAWAYDNEAGLLPRPISPEERYRSSSDQWNDRYVGINPLTGY
jgi:hypothetical protein